MAHGSGLGVKVCMIRFRDRFDAHPCSADTTEDSIERVSEFDGFGFPQQARLAYGKRFRSMVDRSFDDLSSLD